jgi:hypothetical protein
MTNPTTKITLYLFSILCITTNALAWNSTVVEVDQQGCLSYPEDDEKNRIPDFSFAGYNHGEGDLPVVAVKVTISPINGDNTDHVQNAIDQVAQFPLDQNGYRGAVLLNSGTYEIKGELKINSSGVVLRGSGDGSDPSSNTILWATGNSPSKRDIITAGGGNETEWSGQVSGTKTNITTSFVQVGDFSFDVDNPGVYSIGDNIIIHHPGSQDWVDALNGGGSPSGDWDVNKYNIIFNRNITQINGNTITVDAPVYNHLDLNLSQSFIYKYDRSGLLTNIGIENLRIDIDHTGTAENHAKNAVVFKQVENAWATNCSFLHFIYSGVVTYTSSQISVINCRAIDPQGIVTGSRMYNFNVETASNNILFKDCYAKGGRHAYVSNGVTKVSGIVFLRCESEDPYTSSEGHRHWSIGMLYDNLYDHGNLPSDGGGRVLGLYNRGNWGSNHGWSNAHSVAWNCDVRRISGSDGKVVIQKPPTAQNYAIGGYGNFTGNGPHSGSAGHIEGTGQTGLFPTSLYEAQLNCRLNAANNCTQVEASGHDGNIPENVLDNDLNTRWSSGELGEWLQFCLGEDSIPVKGIGIAFYKGDERSTYFDVLGSNDGVVWFNLLSNQTSSGTSLGIEYFAFTSVDIKHLKIIGNGNSVNDWNSITEVQIDSNSIVTHTNLNILTNQMIYPNPTDGFVTVKINQSAVVKLYDQSGKLLLSQSSQARFHQINLSKYSRGVYTIRVLGKENVLSGKVLKR